MREGQWKDNVKRKGTGNLVILFATLAMCGVLMVYLMLDAPSQAEITVITHAREHKILVSEYPESLIRLLERNPETEEFVLNYPFRQELMTDLSGYDRSQGIPLLMQWDLRWGYMDYGGSMVGITGGGPVCLAMVGYYLTGEERFYPGNVVKFAIENGYYTTGSADGWALISQGGPALGLNVKEVAPAQDKITQYLQAGYAIIAAMGPGDFAASDQCVVLTGCKDGQVTVNDPNSYVNSGKAWDYETFAGQVTNLWVVKLAPEG